MHWYRQQLWVVACVSAYAVALVSGAPDGGETDVHQEAVEAAPVPQHVDDGGLLLVITLCEAGLATAGLCCTSAHLP